MLTTIEQILATTKTNYDHWVAICNALSLNTLNSMSKLIEFNANMAKASLAEYTSRHQQSSGSDNRGDAPHYDRID